MRKTNKIIISIIITLMAIFGLCTISNALSYSSNGKYIRLSNDPDYKYNRHLFCVNHDKAKVYAGWYKIVDKITIIGKTSTNSTRKIS